MADSQESRIAALEAKVQELDALVGLALRLLAVEKPVAAVLERYGATESENLAVHALLDDMVKRTERGGMYTPSFGGFVGEAHTYQDVGDASWRAPAELERRTCSVEPRVIRRYRDRQP